MGEIRLDGFILAAASFVGSSGGKKEMADRVS